MSKKEQSLHLKTEAGNSLSLVQREELLPPPVVLEQYKSVDPQFVPFFIEHTKKEQAFRHDIDQKTNFRSYKLARHDFLINILGVTLAFFVVMAFIVIGGYLLIHDKVWAGSSFAVGGFLALIRIFARRSGKKRKPIFSTFFF